MIDKNETNKPVHGITSFVCFIFHKVQVTMNILPLNLLAKIKFQTYFLGCASTCMYERTAPVQLKNVSWNFLVQENVVRNRDKMNDFIQIQMFVILTNHEEVHRKQTVSRAKGQILIPYGCYMISI